MKPILTILFLFCFFQNFAQVDSELQKMIDNAKTQNQIKKTKPVKKDSIKKDSVTHTQIPVFTKKDTAKRFQPPVFVKKDSEQTARIDTVRNFQRIVADSLRITDSLVTARNDSLRNDSAIAVISPVRRKPLNWQEDTAFANLIREPFYHKVAKAILHDGDIHQSESKDYLFYTLIGVVLMLAIIRQLFPKYLQSIFSLLFRASMRQKQKREQLMQETLPSFLMNILFAIVGGLFIALLASSSQWIRVSFWLLSLYSIGLLALIYLFKYFVILFSGWIFNAKEQASTYSFIVFLINKVIGIALLPLLFLLAFSNGEIKDITITIAACIVIVLLLFRYIISLTTIRSSLNINPLHFFIYLCAVELMPMLIIFKVLFIYTGKSNF